MLLAVLGDFGAEPCGSLGKAHLCTGYACLIPKGRSVVLAVPFLTLCQEGASAGDQKHPAGMEVAAAEPLLWHSAVCWDKTKINVASQ